ncbi:MAG: TetR/AcrR family transcriptional regulator [Pseudohongiella sp.]|uniref:TetR/AcrR family transcriptional regulator n=1 Tax=Pseudohongiella sp. TaxID=1979412 RepID=UPI0034A05BCD
MSNKNSPKITPKAGRPVNANPGQQRENIVRAALAEFSRTGFAGTSLRTIAREAGVTHGLIRHYFQGKEELFHSAADYLFGEMAKPLTQAAALADSDDPVRQLTLQVRAYVRMSAQLPFMAGFLMHAGLDGGEHFEYVIKTYVKPLQELSLVPYRKAVDLGLMRNMNPDFVFLIATHAATAPFANAALRDALADADADDAAQIEAYADTLITVLLEGALTEKYRAEQPTTHL